MTENEVLEIIKKEIAADLLDLDAEVWDSLDQVTILTALDVALDGKLDKLDDKELATANTPRKIIDILKKYSLI